MSTMTKPLPRWLNNEVAFNLQRTELSYHPASRIFHYVVTEIDNDNDFDFIRAYLYQDFRNEEYYSDCILSPPNSMFDVDYELYEPEDEYDDDYDFDEEMSEGEDNGLAGSQEGVSLGLSEEGLPLQGAPQNYEANQATVLDSPKPYVNESQVTVNGETGKTKANHVVPTMIQITPEKNAKFLKLSTVNKKLAAKKYKLTREIWKLRSRVDDLEDAIANRNDVLKNVVNERNTIQEARQELQDQLMEAKRRKDELEASVAPYEDKIKALEDEITRLKADYKEVNLKWKEASRTLEDLTREPDDIIIENIELKQSFDECQLAKADLLTQLTAKNVALAEANQSVQDLIRENYTLKSDLENSSEWIYPENLHDVVRAGKKYYSARMVFHDRVNQSIQAFAAAESEKKYRILQEAVKMVKALAETMYKLKFVDNNFSEENFISLTGIQFSMTERKITKREREIEKSRTLKYKGESVTFYPHLKSSIQGTEFRIHFQFLDEERKILVCHIGGHLPTAGTRLNA
jgi:predicted nuclease with TOPRIM domain